MIVRSTWALVAGWLILTSVAFGLNLPQYEHLIAVVVWMLYSVGVGIAGGKQPTGKGAV